MNKRITRVTKTRQNILNYLSKHEATLNKAHIALYPEMHKQTFWVNFNALIDLGYLLKTGEEQIKNGTVGIYKTIKYTYNHPPERTVADKRLDVIPGARVHLLDDRKECLDRHERNKPVRMQLKKSQKVYVSGTTLSAMV